jgi:hypothetical protein
MLRNKSRFYVRSLALGITLFAGILGISAPPAHALHCVDCFSEDDCHAASPEEGFHSCGIEDGECIAFGSCSPS